MDISQLEIVPNQIGIAILDPNNGQIMKSSGDLYKQTGICKSIYNILKDTAKCVNDEPLKRITISYDSYNYIVSLDENSIYIVKLNLV